MTSHKNLARERGNKYNLQMFKIISFNPPLVSIFYHQIKLKKREKRKKEENKRSRTMHFNSTSIDLSVRDILKIWASHLRKKVAD